MIETLVAKGCAYVAEEHVLFHVAAMPDYGQLARRSLDEMQAGARVEVAPYKRDPMDFVLWKPSKHGEPAWPSPLRHRDAGAPGLAPRMLGDVGEALSATTFDIHGGGIDLVFPHHENEVAQSRCANDTPIMANVWMHNGFLQVEGAEDVQEPREFLHDPRAVEYDAFQWAVAGRRVSVEHAADALSAADRLYPGRALEARRARNYDQAIRGCFDKEANAGQRRYR